MKGTIRKPVSVDRRMVLKSAAIAAGVVASPFILARSALAAYPDRPIKIVCVNAVGGPADIASRLMAPMLADALGGSAFVENKPGAGGNIGIGQTARAEPDGYTLMVASNQYMINPGQFDSVPYDPFTDFAPISLMCSMPNCVLANPSLGAATLKDLTALIRKEPGKYNATTSGIGTAPHIGFEFWRKSEGLDLGYVPTGGSGPAAQALLSGTVQIYWGALASIRGHVDNGAAKLLVLLSSRRWHDLPATPTWTEIGYPPPDFGTIMNLFAPAKTPPAIVGQISTALIGALRKPENVEKFRKAGADVVASTPDELKALIVKEVPLWKDISTRVGVQAKKG
jgi:tripartite-type tricarboxylate transporter receptor subunit TctC